MRIAKRYIPMTVRWLGVIVPGVVLLGCGGSDTATGGLLPSRQLFWALQLNHHAVTLSLTPPTDTVQLRATPLSPSGTPLIDPAQATAVRFTVVDNDTSVLVDSTGLVTAHAPVSGAQIVAAQTINGITLRDTVTFNVNAVPSPAPTLTTLSIQSPPGDSAKRDANDLQMFIAPYTLVTNVLDGSTPIDNVLVAYRSSDPRIATIDNTGSVTVVAPGRVMLYAESDVYGVTQTDSLAFTVGEPLITSVFVKAVTPVGSNTPIGVFSQGKQTVGVGALVLWQNASGIPVDVVFDTPSAAQAVPDTHPFAWLFFGFYGLDGPDNPNTGGNIATFAPMDTTNGNDGIGVRVRWFPNAGTYPYHSALYGTSGTITVK